MMLTTFTLDGQPYQVYRQGTQGPVLLMVHGFPMNHDQWANQFVPFASSCQVIAPDLRGMGGSPVSGFDTVVTMEDHADDLVSLLNHLQVEEPVVFIGLSMGGYVAWQMIRKYPDRVKALVLCHTRVIADTPEQASGRDALAAETLLTRSSAKILEAMLPRLVPPASADPAVVTAIQQMIHTASPEGLAATLRGLARRSDVTNLLPTIRVPCLVISGEYDAISTPAEMQSWAKQIPHCRFVSLPGVGHVSPLEAPDRFNQLLTESLPWLTGTMNR